MNPLPLLFALALCAQAGPPTQAGPPAQAVPTEETAPPEQAAPEEPVRLHVVAREKPGFLAGLGQALGGAARSLWEREEPHAVQGNARAAGGDVDGALKAYDDAEKAIPPGGPAAAALAHDRASALLRQGPAEAPRALAEAHRARASSDPAVRALGAYDAALSLEAAGNAEQAIAAYGRTLALDPDDADSKMNLELLLREEERRKNKPHPSAGQQDQKQQQKQGDDRRQAQQQQGSGEQPKADLPKQPGEDDRREGKPQEEHRPEGGEAQQARNEPQDGKQEGQAQPGQPRSDSAAQASAQPLDRSEAQRLLDALRASEKNLQVWRFGKRSRDARRKEAVKDW